MQGLLKENLNQDGLTFKTDLTSPKPRLGEVKIKVLATSVCGTDKSIYRSSKNDAIKNEMEHYLGAGKAYRPIIIGHEFCGIVEELGEGVSGIAVGDYVTAEMHLSCGICYLCRTGNEHICTKVVVKGVHLDGCFADSVVVPYKNVILLSKEGSKRNIEPRVAAMLDAFGNAVHTVSQADVRGKSVAILGAGPLGLMMTMLCRHFGATKIYLTEAADIERRFALGKDFGADACFDVSKNSKELYQVVEKHSGNSNGVDVVLEVSGAGSAYKDAFHIIRNGGHVLLLGLPHKSLQDFDIAQGIIFKGVTVQGIYGRRMFDTWETMVNLLDCDRFGLHTNLEKILAKKEYSFADYEKAFESLISGKEMKLIFRP